MERALQEGELNEEQLKALYDPLRIRIASCLKTPCTPKQVADIIGIRPNNLYHHFRVLLKAGIIKLVDTRKGKGFIKEDYYYLANPEFKANNEALSNLQRQQFFFGLFQALMDDFKTTAERYEKPYALGVREDFRFNEADLVQARNIVEKHCELLHEELAELVSPNDPQNYQLSIFSFRV